MRVLAKTLLAVGMVVGLISVAIATTDHGHIDCYHSFQRDIRARCKWLTREL